jgi:phosphatidylinositol kinase/protein kinase (PI-3  family)
VRSMAAYSIICYMLKVKDRHDGNILLHRDGSVVHIDWGYMLGRSMNAVLEVERAPFKLTRDHVAVMGGETSANFVSYISLCVQGLQVLRERGTEVLHLVRAMNVGSGLVCVNDTEIAELEDRLALKYSEKQVVERFIMLQGQALRSWSTGAYDFLQTMLGM